MTKTNWQLGAVARHLAGPYIAALSAALRTPDHEATFVMGDWIRQHSLLAILDLEDCLAPLRLEGIGDAFLTLKPREFLRRSYPETPAGALRLFARLGAERPHGRGVYRIAFALLEAGGTGAKTLRHISNPTFKLIERLAQLPDWARQEEILRHWPGRDPALPALLERLMADRRLRVEEAQQLMNHRCHRRVVAQLIEWNFNFRLPEPPWPGVKDLRPIRETAVMRAVAARFDNCLADCIPQAMSGEMAYYVWNGREPAVVSLNRNGRHGWQIDQIAAPFNRDVSAETRAEILDVIPIQELSFLATLADRVLGRPNSPR